jgi:hypothetical protein
MTTTPKDLADAPEMPEPKARTAAGGFYSADQLAARDQQWQAKIDVLRHDLECAHARIAAERKDAERFDWIARQHLEELSFALVIDRPHDGEYEVWGDHREPVYGKTFRDAIDAAMQKESDHG